MLEYLERKSNTGTTRNRSSQLPAQCCFRDEHVRKKVQVSLVGVRARLCMAGLLLGTYNILVLDEPW